MTQGQQTEKRYGLLRFVVGMAKVLAWVALVGFSLVALMVLATAAGAPFPEFREAGLIGFFLFVLYGVGAFIFLAIGSESIRMFLDIEEHMRAIRKSMEIMAQERLDTTPRSPVPPTGPAPGRVIRVPTFESGDGDSSSSAPPAVPSRTDDEPRSL